MAKPKESVPLPYVENKPIDAVPLPYVEKIKPDVDVLQKAFNVARVEGGWVFNEYSLKNNQIDNIETSEPDLKSVAIEKLKIAQFKYWSSIG